MTGVDAFETAALSALERLGAVHLRALAGRVSNGWPDHAALQAVAVPGFAEAAKLVLSAQQAAGIPDGEAAAYLRGLAAGLEQQERALQVYPVWSGPDSFRVPVRSTAQVLVEVVGEARHELLLMTYSAKPYPPLLEALEAAVARGVEVNVVVETLQGAGSALSGAEPAAAFAAVRGIKLWYWPADRRTEPGAKMHAKVAVADARMLLVSSANLTQSGVGKNIESGVLVRGGVAPLRAAEHIAELRAKGVLSRLHVGT